MVFGAYWTGKPEEEQEQPCEHPPRLPCGHPVTSIRGDRTEGTWYCWHCEHSAEQEADGERDRTV